MAQARERLVGTGVRIGTGWPVVDEITRGFPLARTSIVRGPSSLRQQLLARTAAWAAGEGYPTLIGTRSLTQDELWMAVGAGGLGLPPRALLATDAHDEWVDARMRVLDLRAYGGPDAHVRVAAALRDRVPALLIIDDYQTWDHLWDRALDPVEDDLDFELFPRRLGCALVLGMGTMDHFSESLDRSALTLRIGEYDDGTRVKLGGYEVARKVHKTVLLREGFFEPPVPGSATLRRPGVTNIWEERSDAQISAFAHALGADVRRMVWEPEDDPREC